MLAESSTASARLYTHTLGFGLSLALAFVLLTATGSIAHAQQNTVVVGGPGGGVTVDLSALDQFGLAADGAGDLRFPGARLGPNDAVRLHPPGAKPQLKRPTKKRAQRKPKMTRSAVPPPPVQPPAIAKAMPDVPPVVPAPRTTVASSNLTPPSPPPAVANIPKQTAARPTAPEETGGAIGAGTTRMIAFGAGITAVPAAAEATLNAAAKALKGNQELRVQLKAYAASSKDGESRARRVSLTRALGVRSFLIKQGVQPTRIDVRALGSKVPSGSPDRVDLSVVAR
ncbi:MAG: outer membrane protein OmpA-like peptidoglycan-associated protein [Alphaproteobacteria bacterium]|jgi:outer membrane protein OmpA-like peptidoglycan-associated protein